MELMDFLYRIMEELAKLNVPIVFKGAMVLNLITHANNPSAVERMTQDIDGDWIGEGPTMEQIEAVLRQAVKNVNPLMDIMVNREYGEKRSAGFRIIDQHQNKVASIDLSVRQNIYSVPYISYINGVTITGASLAKMISDKLYAVSGEHIYRRTKDLLDIYVMSFISQFQTVEIYDIWEQAGRTPGNFLHYRNHKKEIFQAYDRLKGIKNKPDFSELDKRLSIFLEPFFDKENRRDLMWRTGEWENMDLAYIHNNRRRR